MKKNILSIVILLLAFSAINAITLEQAKQLGLKNNLAYKNYENIKKSATVGKNQAYSAILPSVTASGNYNDDDLNLGDKNYALRLSQPIFQGGSILYGMKIAKSQEDMAANSFTKAKVVLISDIENKYYSVLEAKALFKVSEETLDRANIQLKSAETKYQLGAISASDFMQFQLDKSQSDVSLFSSEKQFKTSLKDFNNYLNSDNEEPETIETVSPILEAKQISLFEMKKINSINLALNSHILKYNLDLKNSEESVNNSKSYMRLSQTSFLPSIDFSVSKNWMENGMTDGLENSETYSLNFNMSIFPLINKGFAYKQKKYDYKNSKNNLENTKNNLHLQSESNWLDLVTSAKKLVSAEISLNYATALYEQSTIEFQMGKISSSDYLSSSISLSNAESQHYSAIFNYLRSKSNLNKLLCEENYTVLNNIIFEGEK